MEEWTSAEMGVGAAIASGSQGENGKIALFVENVSTNRRGTKLYWIELAPNI